LRNVFPRLGTGIAPENPLISLDSVGVKIKAYAKRLNPGE